MKHMQAKGEYNTRGRSKKHQKKLRNKWVRRQKSTDCAPLVNRYGGWDD